MNILAIDPGPTESAYVVYDGKYLRGFAKVDNETLLNRLSGEWFPEKYNGQLVIEQIAAMGMAVGAEVFETCFWSGRFAQAWSGDFDRVKRHAVKMHLCGNMRAKDANIRVALIDKFGPGKESAIGSKKQPGPLYGVSGDVWSALAVAITWWETCRQSPAIAAGLGSVAP
jgi:hypothetical protein